MSQPFEITPRRRPAKAILRRPRRLYRPRAADRALDLLAFLLIAAVILLAGAGVLLVIAGPS